MAGGSSAAGRGRPLRRGGWPRLGAEVCVRGPRESTGAGPGPSRHRPHHRDRPGAAGALGPTDHRAARWRPPLALAVGVRGRWELWGARPRCLVANKAPCLCFPSLRARRWGGSWWNWASAAPGTCCSERSSRPGRWPRSSRRWPPRSKCLPARALHTLGAPC